MATINEIKPEERRFAIHVTQDELNVLQRSLKFVAAANVGNACSVRGYLHMEDPAKAAEMHRHITTPME